MATVISPISASIKTHARSKLLFNASILAFVASILAFTISIFRSIYSLVRFSDAAISSLIIGAYLFFNDGAQIFFGQFAKCGDG